jgi:hypothetical protein
VFKQGSNLRSNVEGDRERQVGSSVTRALSKGVGGGVRGGDFSESQRLDKNPVALIFLVACCCKSRLRTFGGDWLRSMSVSALVSKATWNFGCSIVVNSVRENVF